MKPLPHTEGEVSVRRFDHKMVMVVHEAISVAEQVVAEGYKMKCIQKGLAVLIVSKDCFSLIATAGGMVNSAGIFYAEGAGHG